MATQIEIRGRCGFDFGTTEILEAIQAAPGEIEIVIDELVPDEDFNQGGVSGAYPPSDAEEYLVLYEAAKATRQHVAVRIEGAAYCAGLVAMAGDSVTIARGGFMRLLPAWLNGRRSFLPTWSESPLEKLDRRFVDAYAQRTGLPESRIAEMMATCAKLPATQCVRLGFADEITEEETSPTLFSRKGKPMPKTFSPEGTTAKFNRMVQIKMKRGMTRRAAVADTARKNPRLHSLMLLEQNRSAATSTQNAIRAHGGLRQKRR